MLKPFENVLDPDVRFASFVKMPVGKPITLEDHHRTIDAISLNGSVPTNVRTAFERARCAFLYAWFSYELTTLAQVQACSALELALYDHLKARYPDKEFASLNACFEKCIADGDFVDLPQSPGEPPYDKPRMMALKTLLVSVRNEISHGSEMVITPGPVLDVIRWCALCINQIHRSKP